MLVPIIVVPGPPRICAVTKSADTGTNVSSTAANTPGVDSGRTTFRKAGTLFAYRSDAASSSAGDDPFERDVDRQDRERQEVVDEAADDRELRLRIW